MTLGSKTRIDVGTSKSGISYGDTGQHAGDPTPPSSAGSLDQSASKASQFACECSFAGEHVVVVRSEVEESFSNQA